MRQCHLIIFISTTTTTITPSFQDNHPGQKCSPSGASWGRVTGGVQAASAVTPVTSSRHAYILHELFFCTCSCLSSLMHCFRIAVHCDYCMARHLWRTSPLTDTEPNPPLIDWQTHRQKSDRRTRDAPKLYQTSGWVQLKKDFEAVELFIQKHGKPVMVFYRASAYWRAILILQICPSVCLSVRLNTTIVTIEGE